MKIAQIAPLYEAVPPILYGGTERIVSYLTEALVALGHDVTLYASGDSVTSAKLRAPCKRALRLDPESVDPIADHMLLCERVAQEAREFDLIHSHIDYLPFSAFRRMSTPHLTTLHGRLDIPNLQGLYREFSDIPLVSISDYQRRPLPWCNWMATIYHGLPANKYSFCGRPGKYLAFLGRMSREKRADLAIQIARRAGLPLKIAAKLEREHFDFFDSEIRPYLGQDGIEYVGEIGEQEKTDFLGNAIALLFPIDWPEPFGLVMIEAMACGTPVIAYPRGAVAEILEDGVTGYIVTDVESAAAAVKKVPALSRAGCRTAFEQRFTAARMASNYLSVYEKLLAFKNEEAAR